jgi:hypothetical protein
MQTENVSAPLGGLNPSGQPGEVAGNLFTLTGRTVQMTRKSARRKRRFVPTGYVEIETEMAEKIYWISRVKHRTESQILERLIRQGLRKLLKAAFTPPISNP